MTTPHLQHEPPSLDALRVLLTCINLALTLFITVLLIETLYYHLAANTRQQVQTQPSEALAELKSQQLKQLTPAQQNTIPITSAIDQIIPTLTPSPQPLTFARSTP